MIPPAEAVAALLPEPAPPVRLTPLHGDGSSRRFFRVQAGARTYVLLAGDDREENAAYVAIAGHLSRRGVRVPAVHGVDEGRGWILLEDLGDRNLYGAVRAEQDPAAVRALYQPVLQLLVRLQIAGARGFDPERCHARPPYGPELMVRAEGLYFVTEFAQGLLGLEPGPRIADDLEQLARLGAEAPAHYLLHRDFQSRNVHLTPGGPAVIDFQGARFGPLAYDAAALLLDPYASLGRELRAQLLDAYRAEVAAREVATPGFADHWYALGTFRLLQALGAFAKLGGRQGKPGFLEHAAAALATLLDHLGERGRREAPALWALAARCRDRWAAREVSARRARPPGAGQPRS
ncbi:MAG: hypothetical protein Kow0092_24140 [Deferrisomatales bacterium]